MTLTQYRGVARTKIAFVSDRDATKERRSKEIYIADYDGYNPRRVTVNGSLNILPAWSPDGRQLAYTSYRQAAARHLRLLHLRDEEHAAHRGREPGLRPVLEPRRQARGLRRQHRRQHGDLRVRRRRQRRAQGHLEQRFRGGALLEPHRQRDRVHLGPRGHAADLRDGRRGPERAPAHHRGQLERRPRLEPLASSTARSPTPRASRAAASTSPSSTWPPARSGRSPRAAGAASTRPGPRTAATSSSRATAAARWQLAVVDREGRNFQFLSATGPGNNVQPDWGS